MPSGTWQALIHWNKDDLVSRSELREHLEAWAVVVSPTLRDAALRAAPQDEGLLFAADRKPPAERPP